MENSYVLSLKHLRDMNNSLLRDMSDQHIEKLCQVVTTVNVEKGDMIIREGELSDEVFIILEGEVDIIKMEKESGEQFYLRTQAAGESIGEISLLDREPRSASVIATKDSVLLKLEMKDLNKISSENDSVASRLKINFAREMGQRLRSISDETISGLQKNPRPRGYGNGDLLASGRRQFLYSGVKMGK